MFRQLSEFPNRVMYGAGVGDLAHDTFSHPSAMMEIKKSMRVLPHPGRDESRGYAHSYALLFCETS